MMRLPVPVHPVRPVAYRAVADLSNGSRIAKNIALFLDNFFSHTVNNNNELYNLLNHNG
jgi:hypothetical protein